MNGSFGRKPKLFVMFLDKVLIAQITENLYLYPISIIISVGNKNNRSTNTYNIPGQSKLVNGPADQSAYSGTISSLTLYFGCFLIK